MMLLRWLFLILGLCILLSAGMLSLLRQQPLRHEWLTYTQFNMLSLPSLHRLDVQTGQAEILLEGHTGRPLWSEEGGEVIFDIPDYQAQVTTFHQVSLATGRVEWEVVMPNVMDTLSLGGYPQRGETWLYYTKYTTMTEFDIYRQRLNPDSLAEQLTNANFNILYDISPDTQWLAIISGAESGTADLFLLRSDGTEMRRLTDTPAYHEAYPVFSPDGRWVAFTCFDQNTYALCKLPVEGSDATTSPTILAYIPFNYEWIGWSPDGKWLAYYVTQFGGMRILISPAETGTPLEPRVFSQIPNHYYAEFLWSKDSQSLYFLLGDYATNGRDLYRQGIEANSVEQNLTNSLGDYKMNLTLWPFRGFAIDPRGLLMLGVVLVGIGTLPYEWLRGVHFSGFVGKAMI
jgi:hypothetical protein